MMRVVKKTLTTAVDPLIARIAGGRVEVHVTKGEFDLAHRAVDQAKVQAIEAERADPLDTAIADIGLTQQLRGMLERGDILTLRELDKVTSQRLFAIEGFCRRHFDALVKSLYRAGVRDWPPSGFVVNDAKPDKIKGKKIATAEA